MSIEVKLLESSILIPDNTLQDAWKALAALDDPFRTWWNLGEGWSKNLDHREGLEGDRGPGHGPARSGPHDRVVRRRDR